DMAEAAWQGHWAAGETPAFREVGAPLGWRLPPELNSKALRDRGPADYAVRRDSQAADKADGKDIGFRLDDLPKPPPSGDAAPSPSTPPPTTPAPAPTDAPPGSNAEKSP